MLNGLANLSKWSLKQILYPSSNQIGMWSPAAAPCSRNPVALTVKVTLVNISSIGSDPPLLVSGAVEGSYLDTLTGIRFCAAN